MVESKPSPQPPSTVQALLAESLLHEKSASTFAVYDIPVAGFEDYLLRIRKKHVAGVREQLLNSSSLTSPQQSLTVPDFFFVGPNVSQSLLHWGDNKQDIPRIEIVRKHPGTTLERFIYYGFEDHPNGREKENRTQLVKALLKNPAALRNVFEQAAFIGYQKIVPIGADLHGGNIMVGPDLTLSLIDRVGQSELIRSDHYPDVDPVDVAESHIGFLYQTLKRELHSIPSNEESRAAYNALLTLTERLVVETKQAVKDGSLFTKHPEWKGFQRLKKPDADGLPETLVFEDAKPITYSDSMPTDALPEGAVRARLVSAVKLSDPPAKLKLALDRLYAAAVPDTQARA